MILFYLNLYPLKEKRTFKDDEQTKKNKVIRPKSRASALVEKSGK